MLLMPLAAPSPSPTQPGGVNPDTVTPGLVGFGVFAIIAVIAILLILDMVRRIRRVHARYRAREWIAAELRETPEPDEPAADADPAPPRTRRGS